MQHKQTYSPKMMHTHTDSPNDSFLKLSLLVLFDDLGADVCAVVRSRQLVVHAEL